MVHLSGLEVRDDQTPSGDIEITYTGLRPGEKLYEELLIGVHTSTTEHPRIFKSDEPFLTAKASNASSSCSKLPWGRATATHPGYPDAHGRGICGHHAARRASPTRPRAGHPPRRPCTGYDGLRLGDIRPMAPALAGPSAASLVPAPRRPHPRRHRAATSCSASRRRAGGGCAPVAGARRAAPCHRPRSARPQDRFRLEGGERLRRHLPRLAAARRHGHRLEALVSAAIAARRLGIRRVVSLVNGLPPEGQRDGVDARRLTRALPPATPSSFTTTTIAAVSQLSASCRRICRSSSLPAPASTSNAMALSRCRRRTPASSF